MTISHDSFGFLPVNRIIEWDNGKAMPISDIKGVISEVQKEINEDGFLYPPMSETYTTNIIDRGGKTIPTDKATWRVKLNSSRPALLHKLPISHKIELSKPHNPESFRGKDGGFLMHFIGYLFGYRLQFEDWRLAWSDPSLSLSSLFYFRR